MADETRAILQALAGVQQELKNLRTDVQIANHAHEKRVETIQNDIIGLRADLAGVMATEKDNKKKYRGWQGESRESKRTLGLPGWKLRDSKR